METTQEQFWSQELSDDASVRHQFILVGPSITKRVYITDAHDIWNINSDIIFNPNYRIAGTAKDIEDALIAQGINDNEVIGDSITFDNYQTTMKKLYDDELTQYYNWKKRVIATQATFSGFTLSNLIEGGTRITEPVKNVPTSKLVTPSRVRRAKVSLAEKIAALPDDTVLDVSKLTPEGTKTLIITKPKRSRTKFGSNNPDLPIVSNNFDNYLRAIDMLPGGRETYEEDISIVRDLFGLEPEV